MGRSNSASSKCCNSSWLLYLLVILALALSGLNFWMNLYRHEKLRFEVSALDKKLNETIEKIKNPQFLDLSLAEKVNKALMYPQNGTNNTGAHIKARLIYEVSHPLINLMALHVKSFMHIDFYFYHSYFLWVLSFHRTSTRLK